VCLESLRTGGKILTEIVENKPPGVSPKVIESKHMTESSQNLIGNLRVPGRKRVRVGKVQSGKKAKRTHEIKRDI